MQYIADAWSVTHIASSAAQPVITAQHAKLDILSATATARTTAHRIQQGTVAQGNARAVMQPLSILDAQSATDLPLTNVWSATRPTTCSTDSV